MGFTLFCYCCPLIFDDQYLKHSKVSKCRLTGADEKNRKTFVTLSG